MEGDKGGYIEATEQEQYAGGIWALFVGEKRDGWFNGDPSLHTETPQLPV